MSRDPLAIARKLKQSEFGKKTLYLPHPGPKTEQPSVKTQRMPSKWDRGK